MAQAISREAPLILASGSRYRAELLGRLRVPFEQVPADVDESPRRGETPPALAQRLALEKARAVAARRPGRWVLGSDQVAAAGDAVLGKPGSRAAALEQLRTLAGRSAIFYTAVALAGFGQEWRSLDTTIVRFRALSPAEIERYVDAEPSFDCAGSFKSEALGIALAAAIETRDPTALIGLPLIAVRELLSQAGLAVP